MTRTKPPRRTEDQQLRALKAVTQKEVTLPADAAAVFRKMLWLNPTDNQGARFNLAEVEAGREWQP